MTESIAAERRALRQARSKRLTTLQHTEGCHYCLSNTHLTADHIVPRSFLRQYNARKRSHRPEVVVHSNVVYACDDCNIKKKNRPSTCDCQRCEQAWASYHRQVEAPYAVDPGVPWVPPRLEVTK